MTPYLTDPIPGRVFRIPGYTREDLAQERALAALTAPEGRAGLAAKLNLIDLLRVATRGRQAALNTASELEPFQHPAVTDDAKLEARELLRQVRRLPDVHRRVVVLLVAGFDYDEIAAREGLRRKQVDNRLQEARRMLREAA